MSLTPNRTLRLLSRLCSAGALYGVLTGCTAVSSPFMMGQVSKLPAQSPTDVNRPVDSALQNSRLSMNQAANSSPIATRAAKKKAAAAVPAVAVPAVAEPAVAVSINDSDAKQQVAAASYQLGDSQVFAPQTFAPQYTAENFETAQFQSEPEVLDSRYCSPGYSYGYPTSTQMAGCQGIGGCECGGSTACMPYTPTGPQRRDAQEYIFDGGDQQPTVVIREDWSSVGIDPTDTVVYYETETGEVCVQPTNRVPIYAPRFGAVRQVTGAELAAKAVGTHRILAPVQPGRLEDHNPAGEMSLPLAPIGEQQVKLVDAFQENTGGRPMDGVLPAQRMSRAFVPHEDIDLQRAGRITDDEIAVLGRVLQNARTWFLPENLGIVIDNEPAALMSSANKPADVHVYEIRGKCALRICKTASHTIANPGDVINFTIRFDNAGTKELGNVVILDSLAPRLEYIEGSQQSSVDARFTIEPNEVGSDVLRWEIQSPIEKNDGGVISFDCRVR